MHLLIFPELSLTGYELAIARANVVAPDSPELDALQELAVRARMTVVVGAPLRNERDELHIGALILRADGSVSTHSKEYVHTTEEQVFTSGPGGPVLAVGDATAGLAICRDVSFPEHAARASARGATIYAAGALLVEEDYARKETLLPQYAREHGMAVLLANYSGESGGYVSAGKSALWSEDGQLVIASTGNEEALVVGEKEDGAWSGAVLALAK